LLLACLAFSFLGSTHPDLGNLNHNGTRPILFNSIFLGYLIYRRPVYLVLTHSLHTRSSSLYFILACTDVIRKVVREYTHTLRLHMMCTPYLVYTYVIHSDIVIVLQVSLLYDCTLMSTHFHCIYSLYTCTHCVDILTWVLCIRNVYIWCIYGTHLSTERYIVYTTCIHPVSFF